MKRRFVKVLILTFLGTIQLIAQDGLQKDVFPLKVGFTWKYNYQYLLYCKDIDLNGSSTSDSGIVTYRILDSTTISDSVRWDVQSSRNLLIDSSKFSIGMYFDTTYSINDTTTFALWESLSGNHRLHVDSVFLEANPIWKFPYQYDDSKSIFRYQATDSLHRSAVNTVPFGYAPRGSYQYRVPATYVFATDSGLVQLSSSLQPACGSLGWFTLRCNLFSSEVTAVRSRDNMKRSINDVRLYQNYPNPFNPNTTISYDLPQPIFVTLILYDILGRQVLRLVEGIQHAGHHFVRFSASSLPSGIYYCELRAGNNVQERSLVLLK